MNLKKIFTDNGTTWKQRMKGLKIFVIFFCCSFVYAVFQSEDNSSNFVSSISQVNPKGHILIRLPLVLYFNYESGGSPIKVQLLTTNNQKNFTAWIHRSENEDTFLVEVPEQSVKQIIEYSSHGDIFAVPLNEQVARNYEIEF